MSALDDYRAIVAPHCGPHFAFREICRPPSPRHAVPPFGLGLARNIIPTLELANELRTRMAYRCDREGWPFHGLRVNAAYRPNGGAADSQHKRNRALDLDLAFCDWDPAAVKHSTEIRRAWYEVAVGMWYDDLATEMGLGLYCSAKADYGVRVHIDVGAWRRTWQIVGSKSLKHPVTYKIAARLGLR